MMIPPRHAQVRHGIAIIWVAVLLTVLIGLASLAVDYGRVQLAKTQLQDATDAAARYAARYVPGGQSAAYQAASLAAGDNTIDGTTLALETADVQVGFWNPSSRTFTNGGTPLNAVKVSAQRSAARNNPIALWFAAGIGRPTCDIHAESIVSGNLQEGLVGLNGITFKNNVFIGRYDSSITTNPSQSNAPGASMASNGVIEGKNNSSVNGTLILGPSGSEKNMTPDYGTLNLAEDIPTPDDPAWTPAGNPGGIPANYTCSSNTILPGGTYWFTSLTVNNRLSFSGPATVYVNGDIEIGNSITAYGSIPNNLHLYQLGTGRSFQVGGSVTAIVSAPGADMTSKNNYSFYGSCLFNTITAKNNGSFFYDISLGMVYGIQTVK